MPKIDPMGNNLDADKVFKLSEGLFNGWVCAPKTMTQEQVQAQVTWPSGTQAGWVVQEKADDDPHQCSPGFCQEDDKRQHWLVTC